MLELKWCPAHRNVLGNTLADKEARLAAKGEPYNPDLIPKGLVNYRHSPTRAIVMKLTQEENRRFALNNWRDTEAGRKLLSRCPGLKPEDFLTHTKKFNRSQSTLLFRLITGHVQLQRHLHILRLVDSPTCPACGEAVESVSHFVLQCPKYAATRQLVLTSRGHGFTTLSSLFSSQPGLSALLEYVRRTKRFVDICRP